MDDEEIPTDAELWATANAKDAPAYARAEAWYHLAQQSWFKNDYNECISLGEMAEKCWKEAGHAENEGEAAYWQGRANLRLKQPNKALECFERAAEIHHANGDDSHLADALYGAAECHQAMENVDEALIVFESASRFYLSAELPSMAGECRLEMGEMRGSRGHVSESLNDFTLARTHFEKSQNSQRGHRACDRMASSYIEMGQVYEAIRLLRENVDLARFLGSPYMIAHSQYRLGWTLTINDEHQEALHWLDAARAFYAQPGESDGYKAEVDTYRLDALKALGRVDEADSVARGLRAYWRSVGNYARLTVFDANDAYELAVAKNFDEARRLATSAARRAKDECGDWVERVTRLTLAEVEVMAGHPENVRDALEADMAEQWGDSVFNRSRHLMVLAAVAQHEGRPNEARGITERVIELVEETSLRGVQGQAYEMLADLAMHERDESRAQDMRSKAVALYLADGQVARANEIARSLLPATSSSTRSSEWRPIGVEESTSRDIEDSNPRTREMPSSRSRRAPSTEVPGSNESTSAVPDATESSSPDESSKESPAETPEASQGEASEPGRPSDSTGESA
jgi:tetratricopeptide (TPR) repeat protein